ncbi:MAG: tRNA (cytidine(34)-2'-O)-methyltransferase [Eubacterium sp.]|nr:tRNA (cytidine(34)-2'-O)-methyltransferase [Eubacterium sp.]
MINIVLHEPEMPANTGNIGRTCVATGSSLHLIEPLGFRINDKMLERAGLDYWPRLDVHYYNDINHFYENIGHNESNAPRIFYATTKARQTYADVEYRDGDFIMFGKESAGIPEEILVEHPEECIRIPMLPGERSLNLSNSVAIVVYEALRQLKFPGLEDRGELHRLHWS